MPCLNDSHSGAERKEAPGIDDPLCLQNTVHVLHDVWLWIPPSPLRGAAE
jgi:hypothetical protein